MWLLKRQFSNLKSLGVNIGVNDVKCVGDSFAEQRLCNSFIRITIMTIISFT
jgi:hypothetical protein